MCARRLVIANAHKQPATQGLTFADLNSTDRHIRTQRDVQDYQDHTLHSHIYAKPDTYIGSVEREPRQEWIFDVTTGKFMYANVELCDGIIRVALEILSNSGDNADSSRRMGVAAGSIDMSMDRQWCVIRSGGEPIPVVPKQEKSTPTQCFTLVDHIFGTLLTSSNYDPKVIRTIAGTNGFGAKLANIFSLEFRVRVGDAKRGQEHESRWERNMTQWVSSISTPGFCRGILPDGSQGWVTAAGTPYSGPSYVEVAWRLDFKRFGYEEYPDEAFGLFSRYLIDFGLTCKLPVSFNGKQFDARSVQDFAKLCFSEQECATSLVHYEWGTADNEPPAVIAKLKGAFRDKMIASCPTADCIPIVEMCILDTPDKAQCFSYVNGLMTRDGGVHVNEALRVLSAEILDVINSTAGKGKKAGKDRKKKGTAEVSKGPVAPHLTASDVKPHVSMILVCRLPDPGYSSQSKTQLTRPKPKITIGHAMMSGIGKWSLTERLYATLEAKMFKTLTRSDGKMRRHVILDKGEDANEAGGKESHRCVLILVEGASASSYCKKRILLSPFGKDHGGYFPLKGKPLNVTNAPPQQIADNDEISAIKQMMGLREGVDYNDPVERASLRYGFLLDNVDADADGKHINALVLNTLYRRFPSILQLGMFGYLMTPAVRLFNGKKVVHRFYSPEEFEAWAKNNPNHGLRVKYYKGLGSSTDEDIKDDMTTAPMIICVFDDTAGQSLDLAFHKSMSDSRKIWIQKWRSATRVNDIVALPMSELVKQRTITSIINTDLIDYTVDSLFRAIPGYRDGLKKSQRQALYYVLTRWKYGHSKDEPMKVARIANAAAELTSYHHGEGSLMDTIIKMAQDYIGSNNLHFFVQEGQFGTRASGGEDAADGRYSATRDNWWISYVYSKELVDLVPRRYVEGEPVEPVWLPCDIPVHVINGVQGLATGHSTYIPPHSPYDVVIWLLDRCRGNLNPAPLTPWFHNFTGTIEIINPKFNVGSEGTSARSSRLVIQKSGLPNPDDDPEDVSEEILSTELNPENPITGIASAVVDETGVAIPIVTRIKGISMKTKGIFNVTATYPDGRCDLTITELPIGRATHPYRKWLELLLTEKKISDFRDNPTSTDVPNFTVFGFAHPEGASYKTLKLIKSFGLSNMTLICDRGYPLVFNDTQQVMEVYFQSMLAMYSQLIAKRISEAQNALADLAYQAKLITLVVDSTIVVFRQSKAQIKEQMEVHDIPFRFLEKVKLYECSLEEIQAINAKIAKQELELEAIRKTTPQGLWSERLTTFYEALRARKYC